MASKVAYWASVWKPTETTLDDFSALDLARQRAREEDLPLLDQDSLVRVLQSMPPRKAEGADMMRPRDLLRLPGEALQKHAKTRR